MIFSDPAQPYYVGVPEDAYALREQIREEYGFNKPLIIQYFDYLGRVFTLDLGVHREPQLREWYDGMDRRYSRT